MGPDKEQTPRIKIVEAPWVKNRIFNAEYGTINNTDRVRVKRNDPCPCGRGKKFKKCCMGRSG